MVLPESAVHTSGRQEPAALDAAGVAAYLASQMPAARDVTVHDLFRIPGGLSRETWSFDAEWDDDGTPVRQGLIIRRDPAASLLETSRDVEFGVLRALDGSPVPVPRVHWLERHDNPLGSPFFVMSRVPGETAPAVLLTDARYDGVRDVIGHRMVAILTDLHDVEWRGRGIEDSAPAPGDCATTEITRWERVIDEQELEPQPLLRGVLEWLRQHPPPPASRISIVHGDYRTGNFLFDELGNINAVLDWELAHLGDPIEDLGYVATCRFTPDGRLGGEGLVGGLFERDELLDRYEAQSGCAVDRRAVHFWEVLANVKIAAVALTGVRAFCEQRTDDLQLGLLGFAVGAVSRTAVGLVEAGP